MTSTTPDQTRLPEFVATAPRELVAQPITAAAFSPFGRLIEPTADGAPLGEVDRSLDLSAGNPRFYIMALTHRGLRVPSITRHAQTTQVLASVGGGRWLLAVAPPNVTEAKPDLAAIKAFSIPGNVAVLLSRGTWHAGPYFEPAEMQFFNLELEDTNVVDHDTCDLATNFGVSFTLIPAE